MSQSRKLKFALQARKICTIRLHIAPEGLKAGDIISYGGEPTIGNVLQLSEIPIGMRISAIETSPGSGPKLCRSSGSFATVVGRVGNKITVRFSSGKTKNLHEKCLIFDVNKGNCFLPFVT
ncbi:MAG TPA: hypothetical protein EYP59_16480 [Thiotrichaceae bacterium]|nr:hypothetical protein [Thiotrichaceae bacterium]